MIKLSIDQNCPGDNELAGFIDGKLTGDRLVSILGHLKVCTICNEAVLLTVEVGLLPENQSIGKAEGKKAHRHAALTGKNLCVIYAEKYILQLYGHPVTVTDLKKMALSNGWLKTKGIKFKHIGNLLEQFGIEVKRKSKGSLSEIKTALDRGHHVIVGVDAGELFSGSKLKQLSEKVEDLFDRRPDHALIVTDLHFEKDASGNIGLINIENNLPVHYSIPIPQFLDAWDDSDNYMVIIKKK